jgi:hypothetical protein
LKVAVMQPYFFPYIGYWQLIDEVDLFVIYDDVNYFSKGFINRNYILINERAQRLTLELSMASQNRKINEIYIRNNSPNLLKTLKHAYKKRAPFFEEAYDLLQRLILYPEKNLAKYLSYTIQELSYVFRLQTQFLLSSSLELPSQIRGVNRILKICESINATSYVNLPGGKTLYDFELFKKNGLGLSFIQPDQCPYDQRQADFIPSLSIIDRLMFLGKKFAFRSSYKE